MQVRSDAMYVAEDMLSRITLLHRVHRACDLWGASYSPSSSEHYSEILFDHASCPRLAGFLHVCKLILAEASFQCLALVLKKGCSLIAEIQGLDFVLEPTGESDWAPFSQLGSHCVAWVAKAIRNKLGPRTVTCLWK